MRHTDTDTDMLSALDGRPRIRTRRARAATVTGVVMAAVVAAGGATGFALESRAWDAQVEKYDTQVEAYSQWSDDSFARADSNYLAATTALGAVLDRAKEVYASTQGQVKDDEVREKLLESIEAADDMTSDESSYVTSTVSVSSVSRGGFRDGFKPERQFQIALDSSPRAMDIDSASSVLETSVETVLGAQNEWARGERDTAVNEGKQILADSEGRVMDDSTRNALSLALDAAAAIDEANTNDLISAASETNNASGAVRDSMKAWEEEQARIAAEKAERARKEAAAAAAATKTSGASSKGSATSKGTGSGSKGTSGGNASSSSSSSQSSGGTSSSSNTGSSSGGDSTSSSGSKIAYTVYISNTGGQGALDACASGWTNLTGFGRPFIGKHYSLCGKGNSGGAIMTGKGTLIKVVGAFDGTYRNEGVVMCVNPGTSPALPNYDLIAMTSKPCGDKKQSIVGLTKVG